MEMDLGGGIGNKSQEADRNTSSEEKGELSYSASGFESDVSGSLNGRYSGSDENVAGENGDFLLPVRIWESWTLCLEMRVFMQIQKWM